MFDIQLKDHQFVAQNWNIFKPQIVKAFSDSSYNNAFSMSDVFYSIESEIFSPEEQQSDAGHIIAFRKNTNEVVGALFLVTNVAASEDKDSCDAGWFYTAADICPEERKQAAVEVMEFFHETARRNGYKRVISEVGTEAGARFLAKRFGYQPFTSDTDAQNKKYWCCDLEKPAATANAPK